MNADCKILDHYISVCAVFLVHFYSSFNCINKAQRSMSLIFFPCPALTELSVSLSASNEMAEKTIKPLAIKRHKIKENSNACMPDFL